jgi:hypothetical protein
MLGSGQTENGETDEDQSQGNAQHFFPYIKDIIHKEFLLESQIVRSCYYFYCNDLRRLSENVRRLRRELW